MLAPARAGVSAQFLEWLERMDSDGKVFLAVVAIHEIEKGIGLLEHKGAVVKAAGLKLWLAGLITTYDDKIFPVDMSAAAFAGQLEAQAIPAGHDPGMVDATMAGIAKAHDLVIVTYNTKHFAAFGIDAATPDEAVRRRN
jgi:predicted nucleic acid-binding protein